MDQTPTYSLNVRELRRAANSPFKNRSSLHCWPLLKALVYNVERVFKRKGSEPAVFNANCLRDREDPDNRLYDRNVESSCTNV